MDEKELKSVQEAIEAKAVALNEKMETIEKSMAEIKEVQEKNYSYR